VKRDVKENATDVTIPVAFALNFSLGAVLHNPFSRSWDIKISCALLTFKIVSSRAVPTYVTNYSSFCQFYCMDKTIIPSFLWFVISFESSLSFTRVCVEFSQVIFGCYLWNWKRLLHLCHDYLNKRMVEWCAEMGNPFVLVEINLIQLQTTSRFPTSILVSRANVTTTKCRLVREKQFLFVRKF